MKRAILFLLTCANAFAAATVTVSHKDNDASSAEFSFSSELHPVKNDAAAEAKFTLISGEADSNSGLISTLNDGKVPTEDDQPRSNFFLNVGTNGGRVLVDLGTAISVKQVNTFSWHPNSRGPQVYKLYGGPGEAADFDATKPAEGEPASAGWTFIASVDTRRDDKPAGGQYGVSVHMPEGAIGEFRYLLFQVSSSDFKYNFANTFYSEIDVLDAKSSEKLIPAGLDTSGPGKLVLQAGDGKYELTIDTSETPDLREWVEKDLAPVVKEWYPKIVEMLPGEGFEAPQQVQIIFSKDMRGVAAASGSRIRCASNWFKQNIEGEAKGAVVHELVHVVQQYGRARRNNPDAVRPPGWLVEGIPDYIRWFLYEPETKGAEITARNIERAKYDANYRISGNFLNWVVTRHDKELIARLNADLREGKYSEVIWKKRTGKTVQELGEEWLAMHREKLNPGPPAN